MILVSKFIDRDVELEFLRNRYRSEKPELIILYGRRRIGKTYLLQKFLSEVGGLYLLAEESETILEDFSGRLADYFDDPLLRENPLQSWRAFFTYLAGKSSKRLVVIIDEVQYIANAHSLWLVGFIHGRYSLGKITDIRKENRCMEGYRDGLF